MIIGDMEIRLRADIARLQRDMDDARRVVGGAVNGIAEMAKMARGALIGMAAGISFAALLHQVVDAQREFDKLNASLITATGSTTNAAVAFKALQSFAATTPYSVQEATEAFIKMRNLGLDPSERALRSYGNTAAAMGKGLNQMVEAVADAATGEFERLKEFGITAKQNGDRVALTFKGMTANIGNNAKEIQDYLRKIGETDFGGGMELRAATLDGAISNLGDTWQSTLRTIASNGIGEAMLSGVLAVSGALQDLSAILDAVGGAASKEGKAVQEASGLHVVLTTTFEALAVVGTNIAYVFQTIGKDIGAFAAQAVMLFSGGMKGLVDGSSLKAVQDIGRARVAEAEEERKAVDAKSDAILGAAKKSQAAQDAETENLKKNTTDRLAQFGLVLTAEQKRDKALNDTLDLRNRLNGVNAQTAGELSKLKTALDTGAISQAEYNRYVAQVNKDATENSTVYKNAVKQIDLQTSALQRQAAARAFDNQQAQLQIDFLKRTGQLNDEDAINKAADADLRALRDQRDALEAQKKLQSGKIDNQGKVRELQGQIDQAGRDIDTRELKRGNDLFELDQKRYREAAGNYADILEATQAQSKAQQDAVRDGQDEIDMLGMTSKQIAEVTAQRLRDQAAILEQRAATQDLVDWTGQLGAESRKQAEALRAQADQTVLKEELTRQKELWGQIESTAHDTFISIFDSGKSVFDRLRDTLKNGLLELLYQMTLKKWVFQMQADYVGSTLASAGASSASGLTGAANTAVNGASLLKGGSLLNGAGSAIASVGNFVGSSSLSAFGAGFAGNTAGMATTAAETFSSAGMAAEASAASLGASVAAALPYVAAAVAAFAILKKGFGHGATEVGSQGLRGTLTAGSVSGESYQNLHQDGGWFTSDRNWTDTKALSAELSKQLTEGLTSIETATAGFAKSLGVSADWITSYSKTFDIKLTGDQTKDAQAITDFFSGVSDEIASRLVPNLSDFTKSGETAAAALERLAGDFQGTDQVAQLLGRSANAMFGAVGLESATAREKLISAAGGLSTLSQQAQSFNQGFLTDAERLVPVQKALSDALSSLGYTSLQTRDDFKSAINGLIESGASATDEGAKKLAGLLALTDVFAQVHPETATKALQEKQDLQDQLDELTMTSTQLLAKQRDALDDSNKALFDQVRAIKSVKDAATVLTGDVDSAFSVLQKVVEREKAAVQTTIDAHQAAVDVLQGLADTIKSTLSSLSTSDQKFMERSRAQAEIRADLAIRKAGGTLSTDQIESLKTALGAVTQDASGKFATYQEYLKDLYQTQSDIAQLGDVTDDSLWVEKAALEAAQAQLKSLDSALTKAQDQIDVLKGQSTTLLSIDQAIQGLSTAILAAQANPVVSATSAINTAYQSSLGRSADSTGLAYWQQQAASGVPVGDITQAIATSPEATIRGMYDTMLHRSAGAKELNYWLTQMRNGTSLSAISNAIATSSEALGKVPGFATGGDFGGGWRIVGENGPELEATGPARIFSASKTSDLFSRFTSPSSNNDALVAEVKALRQEVQAFRLANSAENLAIAKHSAKSADALDGAVNGERPLLTATE
jgi:hypothetical protein